MKHKTFGRMKTDMKTDKLLELLEVIADDLESIAYRMDDGDDKKAIFGVCARVWYCYGWREAEFNDNDDNDGAEDG